MPNQLFDDDVDAVEEGPLPTGGDPWGAPTVAGAPQHQPGPLVDRARWKWSSLSRGQRIGLAVAAVFVGLLVLSALGKRGEDDGAPPTPPTTATSAPPSAPSTSVPEAPKLVEKMTAREIDDPLRGLPDLHYAVVAYAGDAPAPFSNVVRVAMAGGANPCALWFKIDDKGWQVVAANGVDVYPSDHFPIRVFVSDPCPAMTGNPNPVVKPA